MSTQPGQGHALDEDLHEHWAEQDERLLYQSRITSRTAALMVFSTVSLVASFLAVKSHLAGSADPLSPSLTSLRLLLVVLASGLFGACLSMLIGLRDRLDSASMAGLEKMALPVNLWARGVVGAGGAIVLFAMALGGILEGKLLPQLTDAAFDFRNFAHLVVVCILAGFSEKLVPSALVRAEQAAPTP